MLHHVVRVLPRPMIGLTSAQPACRTKATANTSFREMLQVAAGHAWTRTVCSMTSSSSVSTEVIQRRIGEEDVVGRERGQIGDEFVEGSSTSQLSNSFSERPSPSSSRGGAQSPAASSARSERDEILKHGPLKALSAISQVIPLDDSPANLSRVLILRLPRSRRNNPRIAWLSVMDVAEYQETPDSLASYDSFEEGGSPPREGLTPVRERNFLYLVSPLENPKSPGELYRHLLRLSSNQSATPFSLRQLVDYHASVRPSSQPTTPPTARPKMITDKTIRSAKSYNLLISFALRLASFGTAQELFGAMKLEGIQPDLETWKLKVRYLVRTGNWGAAWATIKTATPIPDLNLSYATPGSGVGNGDKSGDREQEPKPKPKMKFSFGMSNGSQKSHLPLDIWLEFLGTAKRGAFRVKNTDRKWTKDEKTGGVVHEPAFWMVEKLEDEGTSKERLAEVMNNPPILAPTELARTPPRAVFTIVQAMLRAGQRCTAWELTRSYLAGLPPRIDRAWARRCLKILHLHIISGCGKRGLPEHYAIRRNFLRLLSLHRQLRPNSTSVFLLMRSLRVSKYCGTLGWSLIKSFRRRWGERTEDKRVRRRVLSFALKEGRRDIVRAVVRREQVARWSRRMHARQSSTVGVTPVRKRMSSKFSLASRIQHSGDEDRKWAVLLSKVRRIGKGVS